MKIKLKHCPFCGGEAEVITIGIDKEKEVFMPRCKEPCCCARVGRKWSDFDTAVYAWNKRSRG